MEHRHMGPDDIAKERHPDIEAIHERATKDMLYEKLREHIKTLPLREQIILIKKMTNGELYGNNNKKVF